MARLVQKKTRSDESEVTLLLRQILDELRKMNSNLERLDRQDKLEKNSSDSDGEDELDEYE